jgi:hypothetical protein
VKTTYTAVLSSLGDPGIPLLTAEADAECCARAVLDHQFQQHRNDMPRAFRLRIYRTEWTPSKASSAVNVGHRELICTEDVT